MGLYLNPTNSKFAEYVQSEYYVDKTGILSFTNKVIGKLGKYICVSRPRRFGKTMTADTLAAYYSRGYDSGGLFKGLKITGDISFGSYLNQYNVIFLNMQQFLSESQNVEHMVGRLSDAVLEDIGNEYPNVPIPANETRVGKLIHTFRYLFAEFKIPFVFIIDEWDSIFREFKTDKTAQKTYLDFLRNLLKDREYVALAYMTGILPIKKYGTHSALNMFNEFSMANAGPLAEFIRS